MVTVRYRALQRYSYARALLALVELAREHQGPSFEFGPADLAVMERNGLTVTGDDLNAVQQALGQVPGIVEMPA